MAVSPLLAELRRATRTLHVRTEQIPLLARLVAPDLRAHEYGAVLAQMWGFYAPLEKRLGVPRAGTYHYRPREAALRADLAHQHIDAEGLACCRELPTLASEEARWGCLYVLEGAALGGRVITKHVTRALPALSPQALTFFAGDDPPGVSWQAYVAALEAQSGCWDPRTVVHAAVTTFDALYHWMCT